MWLVTVAMGPVTVIAAVAVEVLAVAAVAVPAAAVPDVAVPAAAAPAAAVSAAAVSAAAVAVEVAVAVACWMCVHALQSQGADLGCWMEAEPAGQAVLASGHAQHAQRAELQAVQVEGQRHLYQWVAALLERQR